MQRGRSALAAVSSEQIGQREPVGVAAVFGLRECPLGAMEVAGRREVEDRTRHGGHRNSVADRGLVRGEAGGVPGDRSRPTALCREAHLRSRRRGRDQIPQHRRARMAQHRSRAAREHRCHPAAVAGEVAMANRVDAAVHRCQAARLHSPVDLPMREPDEYELAPAGDAVLPAGEPAQAALQTVRLRLTTTTVVKADFTAQRPTWAAGSARW